MTEKLRLASVKEASALLGLQRSNFCRDHMHHPDFPTPIADLGCGPIWLVDDIEQYLRIRRPRGRPRTRPRSRLRKRSPAL